MRSLPCSPPIGCRAAMLPAPWRRPPHRSSPCSRRRRQWVSASCSSLRRRTSSWRRRAVSAPRSCSAAMPVPGFVYNPMMLAVEGTVIGFVIAVPVGPSAALCIRRSISIGAVAGYLTGLGAALGDAVFGAVAAFGLSYVEQFVAQNEAWLRGIGGPGLGGRGGAHTPPPAPAGGGAGAGRHRPRGAPPLYLAAAS